MALRGSITFTLLRKHMYHNAFRITSCLLEHFDHRLDIVSVYGSEISDTHIFKKHARNNELLETALVLLQFINDRNTAGKLV